MPGVDYEGVAQGETEKNLVFFCTFPFFLLLLLPLSLLLLLLLLRV